MVTNLKICPKCDSVIKGTVCLNCGYVIEKPSKDINPTENATAPKESVTSLFSKFQDVDEEDLTNLVSTKSKAVKPIILGVALLVLGLLSYWRFVYFTPDFISPLVLSAIDVKEKVVEPTRIKVNQPTFASAENERTIQLESDLTEGNFEQGELANFGSLDTTLMIQAFDVGKIANKFVNEELMNSIKDTFDMDEDDIEVYFSKGFAVLFPSPSLERWGFVIQVSDADYISDRVRVFEGEERKSLTDDFKSYYAQVVTLNSDVHYLLISNSKEYLDQMKESSEGNVVNLANDLGFTQSRVDLPSVGEAYLYNRSPELWVRLAEKIATKYEFVGLDKILSQLDSTGSVFYSKDGKLKIVQSAN